MILSKEKRKWIYNKLKKMKSIGSIPFDEQEIANWGHTINVINALELDETEVAPGCELSKYKIETVFKDLILPYQITFKGETLQANLLSKKYAEYKPDDKGLVTLKPEAFNDMSDAIMAAFKKTSNMVAIDTLKGTESLEKYYSREAHDDKTKAISGSAAWCPVEFGVNISKSRFMVEESNYVFEEWLSAILRNLKDGRAIQAVDNKE